MKLAGLFISSKMNAHYTVLEKGDTAADQNVDQNRKKENYAEKGVDNRT